ncbi:MAG: bacillithiol biosynthesis cysteine-adding enzyme BshC [Hydrotalea sp. AMD]|uniref:bacillithiol biosynthesis cysteine-adding enzyme BshC n=2 Tax=unclassified Hydrotalea TaxID=2643788 RepID=UPI00102844D9|nr:bacillithiol biosynthesis cysteine-adding enzyme BshC [Hydrotalea sp. AMD]RWZ90662.1 MAG: bacillithiol biosynthesis cysteine-adding enzyme BshC [Hydrotalea sp. AMD]
MEAQYSYLPIESTGFFSKIAVEYVQQHEGLSPFYQHSVSIEGIQAAIQARQQTINHRQLLYDVLVEQSAGLSLTTLQQNNLQAILSENTFTITTAHQPNIFTGPLYFIYKIIHAIQLADYLKVQLPQYHFIPFYYMGSEDADLDELGTITIDGKQLTWQTKQTGAVGRMKVDQSFLQLIAEIKGQIDVLPHGKQLSTLFANAYTLGKTIQQATLELVHTLFANFGLLILIPDNARLKKVFEPVIIKELSEQFSHQAVEATIREMQQHYPIQTQGRTINLFYLMDTYRERIECENNVFVVKKAGLQFSKEAILEELQQHPERFSGNVILRGLFQETVLPNIVFIGGGGELAYWLELKRVFESAGVPYPMLLLRNSFVLIQERQLEIWRSLQFSVEDLFKPVLHLQNEYAKRHSDYSLSLNDEIAQIRAIYALISAHAAKADSALTTHVQVLQHRAIEKIEQLEKKMARAERRKYATDMQRIANIKTQLFPNNNLQERVENFSVLYGKHGPELFHHIYAASKSFGQQMGIIAMS